MLMIIKVKMLYCEASGLVMMAPRMTTRQDNSVSGSLDGNLFIFPQEFRNIEELIQSKIQFFVSY